MNIPLDRLYHYIENIAREIYGDRVVIYRFWPHGSKNINDLTELYPITWCERNIFPSIWCHDQEPLDYEFYKKYTRLLPDSALTRFLKSINFYKFPENLNYYRMHIFEKALLLHSEKRSYNLEKYQSNNELLPVYYWSHAIIAQDWFRYAKHVNQRKEVNKTFLIYNRAWSNTREYRLRFAELLVTLDLQDTCQTSINPVEPELGIHYKLHKFKNTTWRPQTILENYFPINTAQSHYSADFDIKDYEATDIEVVLETLFDDSRLHLTEKSLRPIACAQPFILAGTYGSLEYLRSYGFKTFDHIWDESYDLIKNPQERLSAIADLMKQITTWLPHQRKNKMSQACAIAEYNKKYFFSEEFFDLIINELKTNLSSAFSELELCNNYSGWFDKWQKLLTYSEVVDFLTSNRDSKWPTKSQVDCIMKLIQNKNVLQNLH